LRAWQEKMGSNYHESVMTDEVINGLHIKKSSLYIDATLGNGGHALKILELGGRVLGIDLDPAMLTIARSRLEKEIEKGDCKLVQGNFRSIDAIAKDNGWDMVDGILFDLGVTNLHLKDSERGFSFENPDAALDMRIDPTAQAVKASDLLNVLREDQLREMFEETLGKGAAKWIAGRVIHLRAEKPISTVADLLEISEGLKTGKFGINEATLPFLALRIAVNSELDNLKEALPKAFGLLGNGGRLIVISFHSGEDALVKDFFREKASEGAKAITFKPILADSAEVGVNRRARSAKMRILEK
jgi:16S rRNA (cytosine1402-N4)-methyltransferase